MVHRTSFADIRAGASSGSQRPLRTSGPPSTSAMHTPKQYAAVEERGTTAATASPSRSPLMSAVRAHA